MTPYSQRILVVDDQDDSREMLVLLLEEAGYQADDLASASEALVSVRKQRPALIITDINMPGMSGLDLISRLQSELPDSPPPVVVLSGFPSAESEALHRGAAAFLTKPASGDDVTRIVDDVLAGRQPVPATLSHARQAATEARHQTSATADSIMDRLLTTVPELADRAARAASWGAAYFGFGCVFVATSHGRELRVLATSSEQFGFAPGQSIEGTFPLGRDILESGSWLLVPHESAEPSLEAFARSPRRVRFFAGVPLTSAEGKRIGLVGLVDRTPHAGSAEDLAILEHVARNFTKAYGRGEAPQPHQLMMRAPALLAPSAFRAFLAIELRASHNTGDTLEVALLDIETPEHDGTCTDAVLRAVDPTRLGIGEIAPNRLGIYKRASSPAVAYQSIARSVEAIRSVRPVRAVGVMCVSKDAPLLSEQECLRFADSALESLAGGGRGEMVRVVLQREPWGPKECDSTERRGSIA